MAVDRCTASPPNPMDDGGGLSFKMDWVDVEGLATDVLSASHISSLYRTTNRAWVDSSFERGVVSSPNADWCPRLRPLCLPVFLRADGTLGQDDPVCWPQYYDPGAPHLPCIPAFDTDPHSPVFLFRRGILKEQVIFTDSWDDGLRVATISEDLACDIKTAVSKISERVKTFLSTTEQPHPRLESLVQSLGTSANKMLISEEPLRELRVLFGITSRFCLESLGYVEYHTKYLPRLTSTSSLTTDTDVIGVWTKDEAVCKRYLQMGIPVWYLRRHSLVPHSAELLPKYTIPRTYHERRRYPEDCFWDDTRAPGYQVLFHERQDDTSVLLKGIDAWARGKLEERQGRTKRKLKREDDETSKRVDGRRRINANVETKNIDRPLQDRFTPKPIRAWSDAANALASVPLDGERHRPRFLPPIDLITGVANEQQAKEFVAVWRAVKSTWLFEISGCMSPPAFATWKAWKSFAAGSFSTSEIQPDNPTSITRINFSEFLGFNKPLTLKRENHGLLQNETPRLLQLPITLSDVRQAVRELLDLDFFFDLFEIEYRRTYDPPHLITQRMSPLMLPGSLSCPLPIPRSRLVDRVKWLVAVRDFMRDWQGVEQSPGFTIELPDPIAAQDVHRVEPAVHRLESAVARVYCYNVTYILRRRPVVPQYS